MKALILFLFLTSMLTADAYAQPRGGTTAARTAPPKPAAATRTRTSYTSLSVFFNEIQEERPEISNETLLEDAGAVQASLPAINYTYAKMKLDSQVAEKAALFAWKHLRLGPLAPTAALTPSNLIDFVIGRGVLVIKSIPTGAMVELDGAVLEEPTEAVQFPSPGTYRIRLTLAGYEPVEENCQVSKDKKTEFIKTLNPIPKKKAK